MHTLNRSNLLTKSRHSHVSNTQRIQRILPTPRLHSRMCRLTTEEHPPLDIRQHLHRRNTLTLPLQQILRPGVRHQTRRRILIHPSLNQRQLPTTALFRRRSQQPDSSWPPGLLQRIRDTQEASEAGAGDEVVAARVADAGEGVIFGVEDDETAAGAVVGGEGGFDAADAGGDLEVELGEEGDEGVVGFKFLVSELGVFVDLGGGWKG